MGPVTEPSSSPAPEFDQFEGCWLGVYDGPQHGVDREAVVALAAGADPPQRPMMCGDCAFRPGSPERARDELYRHNDPAELDRIARDDRFWCHDGLRRRLGFTVWLDRDAGLSVPSGPGDYAPPIIDRVPYRVDGQPGMLCAGWAARRRALLAREAGS